MPQPPDSPLRDPWKLEGKTLDHGYLVQSLVAEGGSGRVYRAVDPRGAVVALKVLRPDPEADLDAPLTVGEEFEKERVALDRLEHPAIVRCLGHGEVDLGRGRRSLFLALEWVDGVTLDKHLAAVGALPPEAALALLRPLFDALSEAHAMGIAHRDLKPGNVMVEGSPHSPRVRLLDFGIAKLMRPDEALGENTSLTLSRNPAFSPAYAAPEQLSGAQTGPWTDVHALALLLTEAMIGRAPYQATVFADLLREALSPQRPTPARHGVEVGVLEPILLRAMALRPQERIQDARALRECFDAVLPPAPAPLEAARVRPVAPRAAPRVPIEIAVGAGVGIALAVIAAVVLFR